MPDTSRSLYLYWGPVFSSHPSKQLKGPIYALVNRLIRCCARLTTFAMRNYWFLLFRFSLATAGKLQSRLKICPRGVSPLGHSRHPPTWTASGELWTPCNSPGWWGKHGDNITTSLYWTQFKQLSGEWSSAKHEVWISSGRSIRNRCWHSDGDHCKNKGVWYATFAALESGVDYPIGRLTFDWHYLMN